MKSTFDHAKRYLEMGLSVIPLRPRDKKPNLSQWEQYQTRRATEKEIESWFKDTDNNVGIVCGKVSGNLVVVDFDDERAFRYCFSQGDGLAEKTLCARTSKGVHVYLRLEETTKKTTLRATSGTGKAKPSLPVDIQGEGGYVVAPPSIHPTGKGYAFISEVSEIAVIDGDQWTRFNGQMRERAEEWPIAERLLPAWNEGSRQNLAMGVSGFFRKIAGFNEDRVVRIVEGICQATGDTEVSQRTSAVHATFSKDVDDVAIMNWLGGDLFAVLKKINPARRIRQRTHKGEGNTDDVDTIIEAGLYNPKARERIPAYDQIREAIELCSEKKDEEILWRLARASRFLGEPSMARYAALEALLCTNHFVTEAELARPEIYYYDKEAGIYRRDGRHYIGKLLDAAIPDCSSELKLNIVDKVMGRTQQRLNEIEPPKGLVCVKNGVFDLNRCILLPHSPEWFFLSRLNVNYDPAAKCPRFEQFLNDVLLPEDILAMEEAIGYLLERGMPFHVMFFLLGSGRNGKGTLLHVLEQFVGKDAFETKSLQQLSTDGFDRAYLHGMLANFSGEVSDKPLSRTGWLKQLSGGDVVDGDRKFLSSIKFENKAKLWFSMNIPPFTPEITLAWWSRIMIFEFRKTFLLGAPGTDPFLREKLTTDEELSGIFNLAVQGHKRLMKNLSFSYTKCIDEVENLWAVASDTVHGWVHDNCEEDRDYELTLAKSAVYENYKAYCGIKRLAPLANNKFYEVLKNKCPWIRDKKATVGEERIPAIRGLRVEGVEAIPRTDGQQHLSKEGSISESSGKQPGRTSGHSKSPGSLGIFNLLGRGDIGDIEDTGVRGEVCESTRTTQTNEPNSDSLATPVRAVLPTEDPLANLQTRMFNEKVKHLQQRACIGNYEHELAILKRSIQIVAEVKGNGDKVSAFALRKDLSTEFTKHADTALRLVDGYYAEIVELGTLLDRIRKSGGQP
jgi:P4 family phage/plasmid primase-like protien